MLYPSQSVEKTERILPLQQDSMFDLLPLGDISLTSLIEQVFPQRSQFLIMGIPSSKYRS